MAWLPEEHLPGPTGRSDLETSPFCMWAELKKTERLLPSPGDLARVKGDFFSLLLQKFYSISICIRLAFLVPAM